MRDHQKSRREKSPPKYTAQNPDHNEGTNDAHNNRGLRLTNCEGCMQNLCLQMRILVQLSFMNWQRQDDYISVSVSTDLLQRKNKLRRKAFKIYL